MKLSDFKKDLSVLNTLTFIQPNGKIVPLHFHITEAGLTTKHFIDCGGVERLEKIVNFQLWNASDTEHRLKSQKLLNIIALSEKKLGITDLEIEVEYQQNTIGKFGLDFDGKDFRLLQKKTACLASDSCGIGEKMQEVPTSILQAFDNACCTPGGNCC